MWPNILPCTSITGSLCFHGDTHVVSETKTHMPKLQDNQSLIRFLRKLYKLDIIKGSKVKGYHIEPQIIGNKISMSNLFQIMYGSK
jgi:hypothetical protein